jgi:RHS repeat-associated protein
MQKAKTLLYCYGARYYDPKVSVWLSVDPLAHQYPLRRLNQKNSMISKFYPLIK